MGQRRVASPVTATTDFPAPDILDECGRASPAGTHALRRTLRPIAEGDQADVPLLNVWRGKADVDQAPANVAF